MQPEFRLFQQPIGGEAFALRRQEGFAPGGA